MNETRFEIKVSQTRLMIKDLEVILKRLDQVMEQFENNNTNESEKLSALSRDEILWSQGLKENIDEIKDMLENK